MTREEGIKMVEKYDGQRPKDLDNILKYLEITEEEFVSSVDKMRDPLAWKKNSQGEWVLQDHVKNHKNDPGVEQVRLPIEEKNDYILTSGEDKFKGDYVLM